MLNTIIFSRDRACQLDALLRSMPAHLHPTVLYMTSNARFEEGYEVLMRERSAVFVREVAFRQDLAWLVDSASRYTMFLCDDDVFVRDMPPFGGLEPDEVCFSLRLAPGLTYCFPKQQRQDEPKMKDLRYEWLTADGDYGYPMSLDGHVFRTSDIMAKIKTLEFECPNTFEAALAREALSERISPFKKHRPMIRCVERPVVVNIPLNQVQRRWMLPNCNVEAVILNELYLKGKRMRVHYKGNVSCHAAIPVSFT